MLKKISENFECERQILLPLGSGRHVATKLSKKVVIHAAILGALMDFFVHIKFHSNKKVFSIFQI